MNFKNSKIAYFIISMAIVASVLLFYFYSKDSTNKERRMDYKIKKTMMYLSKIKKNINKNETDINKIKIAGLRYSYLFNKNGQYFMKSVIEYSKKYNIILTDVKKSRPKVSSGKKIYSFLLAGHGKSENIYLFVKALEYNDKAIFDNFTIGKSIKTGALCFHSNLSVNVIRKSEVLSKIEKIRRQLNEPIGPSGLIDPFLPMHIYAKKQKVLKHKPHFKNSQSVYPVVSNIPKQKPSAASLKSKVFVKTAVAKIAGVKSSYSEKLKQSRHFNGIGVSFFKKNEYGKALSFFKMAILTNPNNYRALSNAALDCYENKNYDDAVYYGKKAVVEKNIWQINFILGLSYRKKKEFHEAAYYFKKASQLDPSNQRIKNYLKISEK